MTTEELMKPRFKVTGPYPDSPFKVGDIISMDFKNRVDNPFDEKLDYTEYWHSDFIEGKRGRTAYCELYFKPFPHLFKELHWSEDREIQDLPAYTKDAFIPAASEYHKVYRMDLYEPETNTVIANGCKFSFYSFVKSRIPATKEEYESSLCREKP